MPYTYIYVLYVLLAPVDVSGQPMADEPRVEVAQYATQQDCVQAQYEINLKEIAPQQRGKTTLRCMQVKEEVTSMAHHQ